MTKFMMFYKGGFMPETEAEQAAVMQTWMDWYKALGSGLADAGNPFTPSAKRIASDGTVSDFPSGSMAFGYIILEAESLDHAVKMAQGCPNLQDGGEVSVLEIYPVM